MSSTNKTEYTGRDQAHLWHPYTRFSTLAERDFPVIVSAEGAYVNTDDGRRLLDAISSWWCVNLGHSHPALVNAITRQASALQHSILGNMTHPPAIELAERIARLMPSPDRHVLFASDGSSAVEQAVKIAIQYRANTGDTQRTRLAYLEGDYHGDTLGAMALGYLEHFHRPFKGHLFPAVPIPFPGSDDFTEARETLTPHADELTAVIVEPLLQGAAGMRVYSADWLKALANWCKAHDVLLILDEIATGFGRTGKWFAFEHAGIDPDIVCLGKGLSGGMLPISATVVRDAIYNTFSDLPEDHTLQHGHTFCGNPIACAASLAAIDIYADGIIENVPMIGKRLREKFQPLENHPLVKEIRSIGLMTAIELHSEQAPADGPTRPHRIRLRLLEKGILLRPLGNVIYVMPPFVTPEDDLARLADAVMQAIEAEQNT